MKKLFSVAVCAALIGWAGSAMALPTTWTDNIETDHYIGYLGNYEYTHNIADSGFQSFLMTGNDIAYSYNLTIGLRDDQLGDANRPRIDYLELFFGEGAAVDQPGFLADGTYNFSATSQDYGWSVLGLVQLNLNGTLDVNIFSTSGDFTFDYSRLTVSGDNGTAPVPEPTTMLLFGTGLAGLAAVGRRRKATKA